MYRYTCLTSLCSLSKCALCNKLLFCSCTWEYTINTQIHSKFLHLPVCWLLWGIPVAWSGTDHRSENTWYQKSPSVLRNSYKSTPSGLWSFLMLMCIRINISLYRIYLRIIRTLNSAISRGLDWLHIPTACTGFMALGRRRWTVSWMISRAWCVFETHSITAVTSCIADAGHVLNQCYVPRRSLYQSPKPAR